MIALVPAERESVSIPATCDDDGTALIDVMRRMALVPHVPDVRSRSSHQFSVVDHGMRIIGVLILGAVLAVGGACGSDDDDVATGPSETTRDRQEDDGGTVDADDLEVGDCFDDPKDAEANEGDISFEASEVETVPCNQPHDNEVFLLVNAEGEADAPFPGNEALEAQAQEQCLAEFPRYVGLGLEESIYNYGHLLPSEETWANGDREIVCIAYHGDLMQISKSVRGSAQ